MEDSQQQALRSDQHYLPMRVNEPMMVIFWDVDEVRPIILSFALGVPFDAINYVLPVGLLYFYVARRIKAKYAKGILNHIAWWHGILPMKTTRPMPDPLIRALFR
ncbi:type IV conjugative transfer system protein TraL [Vibrio parahaemolyticus]|uniref:type IV conjugative transfer system protein TraL n=1 Tax=Vibrio parahaemolyticus TaxID=670 RepID=UPI00146DB801|nr:type IV conjugative transfer system protein TraL [Vibrio parahaemolyticus]NMR84096.1 type IV conjugative transfer system protein TraL [Vibrio parahaemolyticus]